MPIQKIVLHKLKMRLNKPFSTSFGTINDKEFFIIEAIDDEGNHGFGESVAFTTPWYTEETTETCFHILQNFLIPLLRENKITHPNDISQLFSVIKRNNMAKAAIEGAIWDLHAKRQGISLAQALGGKREWIDVGVAIGIQPTMKDLLHTIERHMEAGFKRIKLKIKPGQDIEVLREVRQAFPYVPIMADANSAYTLKDIALLKELDAFDLMMVEQPLAHDDIVDHATLQRKINTPICLDESIHSFDDVRHAIALGSCKIINIKTGRVGGLTEAVRIHDLCRDNEIPVWCGGMLEAGVGRVQNIALAALAQFTLPADMAGSAHYWEKDIIFPEVVVEDGRVKVPDRPGIGYEIDRNALEQFTVQKMEFHIHS
ncbi:o-succinylbenzoate synthase [Virgibacillus soli]|uniref:o-succinylbenzoate synthase n=1 Tax=Paracerasibacillus soli TaxID=480284 RepID=A0ABU5CMJ3_9BACI|nr:o-succinylbenzoate synthase [Virgibacillus soli]MDY0407583.1 o-succinylbenzoate synthase [Virgibacillus soli]